MAVFKFVTKGTQTLQGKQKIYFCAHPRDYDTYFERTKNDILNSLESQGNTSCALLYLEDPSAERTDEFFFDLKEMDMIVLPITYKFLKTSNPALDSDFRFAANNDLIILPIIMEPEISDLFNKICGNLQYLDTRSKDVTAIPYEEKLLNFLTSHLVNNEMYEKIRKAFDAYIFLSYRKKDRACAQELMRLIHKNDFCRDIAIWYDEFLTPGENFNDSIKVALEKSELFALAVTPNIINEKNYIMSVEYPMAKQLGKPIVPAELVKTNSVELSYKYPDIPNCIDAHNEQQLSSSLANALRKIAIRENDSDPEHNFFIGLAYLIGIDVEKDPERAVSLITAAADAGLSEAMKKLVSIFNEKDSNYKTTILWQKRLVAQLKKEYDIDQTEDSAYRYLSELCKFVELYIYFYDRKFTYQEQQDEFTFKKRIHTDVLKESKTINSKFQKPWSLYYLSKCYINFANRLDSMKNYAKVEKYYSKAIELAESLAENANTARYKRNLGITYQSYAKKLLSYGLLDDNTEQMVSELYQKAINTFEELNACYNTNTAKYDLANIYFEAGKWDLEFRETYFSKYLSIIKTIADKEGTLNSKKHLPYAYSSIAYVKRGEEDFAGTEYYFDEALKLFEEIVKEYPNEEEYYEFSTLCLNAFHASGGQNKIYLKKMLEIYDTLISDHPEQEEYRQEREWIYRQLTKPKPSSILRAILEDY